MSLSDVSNILWRERQLLELARVQARRGAARARLRPHALALARDARGRDVLGEIKRVELERAMAVAGAISELGLSDSPTLRELAAIAPTPWDGIFVEHRRALLTLAQEIEAITKSNRELFQRGQQAAREALASLGEIDIDSYDASGTMPDRSLALRLVDKAI